MSETLEQVKILVRQRLVRVSDHGMDELRQDGIRLSDILASTGAAETIEDYPLAFKGPTVLALQDVSGKPIHVVWELAKASPGEVTLVTAYVPDPQKWYDGFRRRKPK